ncbi:hypothetical protein ACEN4K_03500 [Marinilactibacillus psychrotolerans]|uniref:hypothetical protein n=1 Tax=Marinilactibacillus psychrotolerans TaxID=191770 RepID=UPI003888FF07
MSKGLLFTRDKKKLEKLQYEMDIRNIEANYLIEIPKKVYKYTNVQRYVIENLNNNYVSASLAKKFNDIKDSIMITNNRENIIREYDESVNIAKKAGYEWPVSKDIHINNSLQRMNHMKGYLRETTYVLCLTSNYPSEYMSGMYINNEGIVIEYDTTNQIFQNIYPVVYGIEPLEVQSLVDLGTDESLEIAMLLSATYKNLSWQHEEEWRYLLKLSYPNKKLGDYIPLITDTPSSIYLGLNYFDLFKNNHTINEAMKNKVELLTVCYEKAISVKYEKLYIDEISTFSFDVELFYDYGLKYLDGDLSNSQLMNIIENIQKITYKVTDI